LLGLFLHKLHSTGTCWNFTDALLFVISFAFVHILTLVIFVA